MIKKRIIAIALLLTLFTVPFVAIASDISDAKYYGIIQISNNSTATTNVATTCNISTQNLIDGNYLNSSANNCVIRTSSGADVPFMPSVNATYPWCIWVPSIGTNGYQSDILYTANSTGGEIRYFPGTGGMTTADNASLELADNFTIEQKGWTQTTFTDNYTDKNLVYKPGAFKTYVSGSGNITSLIFDAGTAEDFTTYTEVDPNAKLTVTAFKALAADADRDEDVYLYKDKGINYFNTLAIDFELYIASTSLDDGFGGMAIANTVGSFNDFVATDITCSIARAGAAYRIYLARGKNVAQDFYTGAADTLYYCSMLRPAGNDQVDVKIYTDAAKTVLVDTIAVAGYGVTKYQYAYGFVGYNAGVGGKDFDGYVQNLRLPISVTATGVSSGNHTVVTSRKSPFLSLGIDAGNDILPVSDNLVLNAPMWQTELNSSPFTTIDLYAHSCTVTGATWSSSGYYFDGINDLVSCPDAGGILASPSMSGEIWVNFTTLTANHCLFGKKATTYDQANGWYMFYSTAGGKLYFGGSGALQNFGDVINLVVDTPYHIAFSASGTTANVSVNGVLAGAITIDAIVSNADEFRVGKNANDFPNWLDAVVGEARIYNRALTQAEIVQNYNTTKWKYTSSTDIIGYSTTANVTDNSANWTFLQNNVMPYMEYHKMSVNNTLQQHIEWEYTSGNFTDLSGKSHDATPSFRTASSDADVSAILVSFLPIAEAKAPDYALGVAPPFFTTGNVTGAFTTTPGTSTFPLANVIIAIANATATPPQLPLLIIAIFIILACSLSVSAVMRRYGSGSIFVKGLIICGVMGVFVAIGNFAIDFWMLITFAIIWVALAMASRQLGWS